MQSVSLWDVRVSNLFCKCKTVFAFCSYIYTIGTYVQQTSSVPAGRALTSHLPPINNVGGGVDRRTPQSMPAGPRPSGVVVTHPSPLRNVVYNTAYSPQQYVPNRNYPDTFTTANIQMPNNVFSNQSPRVKEDRVSGMYQRSNASNRRPLSIGPNSRTDDKMTPGTQSTLPPPVRRSYMPQYPMGGAVHPLR
eukprot:Platyproteum_vivax@DN7630_c2_g2_i2.p1